MFNIQKQQWQDHISILIITRDLKSSCKIHIYDDDPNLAYVSDLYVDPEQRCSGIGSKILSFCEECAKNNGCGKITLISDINDWVRSWYKRIGYYEVSSQVVFEKKLIKYEEVS